MTSNNLDLGEQALSKVAEVGISSQLDEVEEISVDIRTNPLKLMQGQVESVEISGSGMVMKQDLRMETLIVTTDEVAIDPLRAVLGNIELTQPMDAQAQAVLTEADINRAFNSDFLKSKLPLLTLSLNGQSVAVDIQSVEMLLPDAAKAVINADFLLGDTRERKKLSATVVPTLQKDEQRIGLEILSIQGEGLTPDLANAILDSLSVLLDLNNFDIPGMSFHVNKLDFLVGKLIVRATTQIDHLPNPKENP
jgi:LmeA-like phospholipid-binding